MECGRESRPMKANICQQVRLFKGDGFLRAPQITQMEILAGKEAAGQKSNFL